MEREYVGIDYHRRRSVLVRRDALGESLGVARVVNDPLVLAAELAKAGPEPEVVIEATYGWYWVVDLLREQGAEVHLAHPLGKAPLRWRIVTCAGDRTVVGGSDRCGEFVEGSGNA